MPADKNYSMHVPLGTEHRMNRRILTVGLDSFENDVLNSMNVSLLGFGKVTLDEDFRSEDKHSFCNEINIILKGRGKLCYNGRDTVMTPGNIYFFPAGGSMLAHGNEPLMKIYFQFRSLMNGCEVFHDARPLSAAIPRSVIAAMSVGMPRTPDVLSARADVLRALSIFSGPIEKLVRHRRDDYRRFEPFFRYVNTSLRGDFSLADFGAHSGQSAKNFSALFKKQFGESPKKYFLREKVNRIKEALYYSDTPLADVSESFGFSDQFYFSRFFKKMSGITPSEYRSSAAGRR